MTNPEKNNFEKIAKDMERQCAPKPYVPAPAPTSEQLAKQEQNRQCLEDERNKLIVEREQILDLCKQASFVLGERGIVPRIDGCDLPPPIRDVEARKRSFLGRLFRPSYELPVPIPIYRERIWPLTTRQENVASEYSGEDYSQRVISEGYTYWTGYALGESGSLYAYDQRNLDQRNQYATVTEFLPGDSELPRQFYGTLNVENIEIELNNLVSREVSDHLRGEQQPRVIGGRLGVKPPNRR